MRNYIIIILITIPLILCAEWVSIDKNHNKELFNYNSKDPLKTEINFNLDGYDQKTIKKNNSILQEISYENEGEFLEPGKPGLPRFSRLVAIPEDSEVSIRIIGFEEEVISDITIYPSQEKIQQKGVFDNNFEIDDSFYQSGEIFPQKIVQLGEMAILRDLHVVNVTVNPFQFDPINRELHVYSNVQIELEILNRNGNQIISADQKISRFFEPLYRSSVLNYDEIRNNRDLGYQNPCYLLIYPQSLGTTDLQYLIEWRREKGFDVRIADTSNLQAGSTLTSIKNYIQTAYDTWENPPEFVCLVGDGSGSYSIPSGNSGGGEGDQFYSLLDGNDILADVWVGRISIGSTTDLQTIIAKILNYEKSPLMFPSDWLNNILLVGDPSSSGESTIIINKFIKELAQGYSGEYTFDEAYSGSYVSRIESGLNTGCSYFNYRGYLGMSGWSNTLTNGLSNGSMLPLVTILTCGTGSFANGESRSEVFLRAGSPTQPRGAIASVGTATIYTHTCCNNCVVTGMYYGIFSDEIYQAGGALSRGKLNLYINYPDNQSNLVNNFSYWNNLMGDPALELWTGEPKNLGIICDYEIGVGANYLDINVIDDSGFPASDVWVTAYSGNQYTASSGYTNDDGDLLLSLGDLTLNSGTFMLTASKHNFIPQQNEISVNEQDKYVAFSEYVVDDDNIGGSIGNNDGMINPGETIELNVGLENFGTETVTNVTADITTSNNLITIIDNTEEYGDIASGTINFSADNYDIEINDNVLGGSEIRIDIQIADDVGNAWDDFLFLPIDGINFTVESFEIDDPNNILDPGETAEMIITIANTGTVDGTDITATLACANSEIIINDNESTFGTIASNSSGDNNSDRFSLSASNDIIPGSQIPLVLTVENPLGFSQELTFMFNVGDVSVSDPLGPDDYGYYAYDSSDLGYASAPVYDWIEIDPSLGGSGTSLNFNDFGDDGEIADVDVPFNLKFYGIDYSMITICSNGFLSPGGTEQYSYMNWSIPGPLGPSPMIAPFWDDLMTTPGNVFYYYDDTQNYFVVEWSDMRCEFNNSVEIFEVIIYDPAFYPTPTGDAEIVFQYNVINNVDAGSYTGTFHWHHGQYATVGLEDHTGRIGLQHTYNNTYPTAAATLQNGHAIKFTTVGSQITEYPVISLSTQDLDFGEIEIGESVTDTLYVSNIGSSTLEMTNISNSSSEFTFNTSNTSVAVGQIEEIYMTFTPVNPGIINDVLTIESNDPIHPEINIVLEGEGLNPTGSNHQIAPLYTSVFQNHPNPFNPKTTINFALHQQQNVKIIIFNIKGEKVLTVIDQTMVAGNHSVFWKGDDDNGKKVSSGIYFYKFSAGEVNQIKKMLLLK